VQRWRAQWASTSPSRSASVRPGSGADIAGEQNPRPYHGGHHGLRRAGKGGEGGGGGG
jgi:hypothetical protein